MAPPIVQVRFVAVAGTGLELDDGRRRRPVTLDELTAQLFYLKLHGHVPGVDLRGDPGPAMRNHLRRFLSQPGRRPAGYHGEWAGRWREIYEDLCARYEIFHIDGDRRPTRLDAAVIVAIEDHDAHPERWSYDPETNPANAARRVWKAVKPLI